MLSNTSHAFATLNKTAESFCLCPSSQNSQEALLLVVENFTQHSCALTLPSCVYFPRKNPLEPTLGNLLTADFEPASSRHGSSRIIAGEFLFAYLCFLTV